MLRRPLLTLLPVALLLFLSALVMTPPAVAFGPSCHIATHAYNGYAVQVATPIAVATVIQPVPVALFTYTAAPTTPPPVTVSAALLNQQQQRETDLAAEVRALKVALTNLERQHERDYRDAREEGPPSVAGGDEGPPMAVETPSVSVPRIDRRELVVRAAQIASQHCSSCHSSGDARGGVVLFDAAGTFAPEVSFRAMAASLVKPRRAMPLGNPTSLEPAERGVFAALAQLEAAR